MSESIPFWRHALTDKESPLYQAAWLLFGDGWRDRMADRLPAEHREAIIAFCYRLIDTEELYFERATGKGNAPANAMRLLAYWQITDAIPVILEVMHPDAEEWIFEAGVDALGRMGEAVIEPVLAYSDALGKGYHELKIDVCEILCRAGNGSDRIYQYIHDFLMQIPPSSPVVTLITECLLRCNAERAIPFLERLINRPAYREWHSKITNQLALYAP